MRKSYFKASLLMLAISVVLFAGGNAQAKDNSWGHISDPAVRFQVLSNFNGEAVLDRDTGLIWEQCPLVFQDNTYHTLSFLDAVINCYDKPIGNTTGWRMPTAAELKSLMVNQTLPTGAPFCDYNPPISVFNPVGPPTLVVQNRFYWTYTLNPVDPTKILFVSVPGDGGSSSVSSGSGSFNAVWCVRGGSNDSSGP
jgi:uncharacterized protein DUF1566